jgi:hypothetical protein
LNELNRIDKHRFIHVGFVAGVVELINTEKGETRHVPISAPNFKALFNASSWTFNVTGWPRGYTVPLAVHGCNVKGWRWTGGVSDDRTEILRVAIEHTGPKAIVKMHPGPGLAVSLGDPQVPVILPDLDLMRDRVKWVVDAFRPLFT